MNTTDVLLDGKGSPMLKVFTGKPRNMDRSDFSASLPSDLEATLVGHDSASLGKSKEAIELNRKVYPSTAKQQASDGRS